MKFCNSWVFFNSFKFAPLFHFLHRYSRITYSEAFSSLCQCKSIKNQIHLYINRICCRLGKCLLFSPLNKKPADSATPHYLSNVICLRSWEVCFKSLLLESRIKWEGHLSPKNKPMLFYILILWRVWPYLVEEGGLSKLFNIFWLCTKTTWLFFVHKDCRWQHEIKYMNLLLTSTILDS